MSVYHIVYTNNRTGDFLKDETDWVCDASWDIERVKREFETRYPSTKIFSIAEVSAQYKLFCAV